MRQDNIEMFKDTLSILKQGFYMKNGKKANLKLTAEQMKDIYVYLPDDIKQMEPNKSLAQVSANSQLSMCSQNLKDSQVPKCNQIPMSSQVPKDSQNPKNSQIAKNSQVPGGRVGVSCVNTDSFTLARQDADITDRLLPDGHLPVLVLNLANPVNPGGGVRRGAKAQEEDLCRKSSLLLSLESSAARKYYDYNKSLNTYMGSDAIMITPQVEIIKDEQGNLLDESVIVAVMTCAAPMLTFGREGMSDRQYQHMVYKRIMGMLKVAANLGYPTLVLGAFGCGAFDNDAKVVSDLFYMAMKSFNCGGAKLQDCFCRIDFAVMDHSMSQYNFKQFARNFNDFYRDEDAALSKKKASENKNTR